MTDGDELVVYDKFWHASSAGSLMMISFGLLGIGHSVICG